MSRTVDFEVVFAGVGIFLAIIAVGMHSAELGLAGAALAALAGYAAWLDRRG